MRSLGTRIVLVIVALAGTGQIPTVSAQDASDWLRVNIVSVVPERLDDFIELQLSEVNPGLRTAGIPWRSAFRIAEFGNSYELHFVTPIGDIADYDTGGPLARVMEPDKLQRLSDRLRRYTVSRRSYAIQYRPELSVESDEISDLFLARLSTIEVAPGRGAEWTDFLEDSAATFRGAGVVFGVYERMFGPGPASWQIIENHASFTELAEPTIIARAFGERAGTVAAELAGVVVSVERTVLRYDPELSYSSVSPQ